MKREDLIEYLCTQQLTAFQDAALVEGWHLNPSSLQPWSQIPEERKSALRTAMLVVLSELEDMGYLKLPVPAK
jgi:hypothetical protein